ncbi:MAG: NAD(P)-dependent oxidoreductase, partial [Candidatus Marinimicrobia bacterium]|nr:NAD(P)-dependent oxidoreductase [Candidatus Neomarinimicrobiota bacterium]
GKNGPYSENDIAKPINKYGATKLESEKLILENNPGSLVIRSNVVYDYNLNTQASFLNWVIQSLQNNLEIQVVNDQINNPTWSESLAQTIVLSIEKHISGIAHWGGADYLNRYDFAVKIAKKFSLNSNLIKPIETEELNQPAKRPLNSGLKTSYLSKKLGISPLTIDECLETILKRVLQ